MFLTKHTKVIKIAMVFSLVALFCFEPVLKTLAEENPVGGDKTVEQLSGEIKEKQNNIDALREKINAYEKSLSEERSKSSSLRSQIYILETQIQKKEAEIQLNEDEIAETLLQIEKTQDEIKTTGNNIDDKQTKIARFLRELYQLDQKTDLEVVIMNKSISDFFNQMRSTEKIQGEINDILINLKEAKVKLEQNKTDLDSKNLALNELKAKLEDRKANLEDQTDAKQYILQQTRSSEARYQSLIVELKEEQDKINSDIVALEKAMRKKLSVGSTKLEELGDVILSWPVPSRVVTATFHDPDYPFRHIFEHPAIDIKAGQGTPVRAAASGYVARVQNGGKKGYSYIMIVHNNGFATVYGHVSAIYVETDQFVSQGEVIAASGGMPGTLGAGRLTTGPHLHFELRSNGIPINPLDYLP